MKEKILIVEDEFVEAYYLRSMLERAGYTVCGTARSVPAAKELITQERPGLVLLDIFLSGKLTGIDLAKQLKEQNIAFVYLSANSNEDILTAAKATQPYGFLVKPFRENDLLITLEIARYRHEHSLESKYRREAVLQTQLENIITDPASPITHTTSPTTPPASPDQKLLAIARALQPYIPFDLLAIAFSGDSVFKDRSFLRIGFDEYQSIGARELSTITGLTQQEIQLFQTGDLKNPIAAFYTGESFKSLRRLPSLKKAFIDTFQMESHLSLPLYLSDGQLFNLYFFSRRPGCYTTDHIALFGRIQQALTKSLALVLPHDAAQPTGNATKNSPAGATKTSPASTEDGPGGGAPIIGFEGIVGKSHLLLSVFDTITQVAPSDTSILILGESGTGKEMISTCIHNLSRRKGERLVKVNCAAIPPTLIESELFGHEKGSFTGALDKRIGKFEQADKGTILLDEIGEIPLELQAKLLHVLQDREIERIGSKAPIKIDVRVIAATNRNLEKEVAEGRFRLDLYYRLNVIPITLPPLRERKEDIMDLCTYFIRLYNRKAGRKIVGLSEKAAKTLMAYDWPGNIRELEHLIERCVLLAKGTIIEDIPIPSGLKKDAAPGTAETRIKTIQENERDHIISVLKKCNGRIWGPGGAAEMLNVPPTTLRSKMKKLGIEKKY